MNLEYKWTKEDLKKELLNKRYKTNIIFFIMGILLYIWLMYDGIKSELFDNIIIFIGGVIFTFILALVLFITTKVYVSLSIKKNDRNTNKAYGLYKLNLDDKKIMVTINNEVIEYEYKDIIKVKKRRHSFFIRTKDDKIGLLFKENMLGKENYNKVLSYITSRVGC